MDSVAVEARMFGWKTRTRILVQVQNSTISFFTAPKPLIDCCNSIFPTLEMVYGPKFSATKKALQRMVFALSHSKATTAAALSYQRKREAKADEKSNDEVFYWVSHFIWWNFSLLPSKIGRTRLASANCRRSALPCEKQFCLSVSDINLSFQTASNFVTPSLA